MRVYINFKYSLSLSLPYENPVNEEAQRLNQYIDLFCALRTLFLANILSFAHSPLFDTCDRENLSSPPPSFPLISVRPFLLHEVIDRKRLDPVLHVSFFSRSDYHHHTTPRRFASFFFSYPLHSSYFIAATKLYKETQQQQQQ